MADFDCPMLPEFYTPSEKSESSESSCGNICCYDQMLRAKIAAPIDIDPMELWKKEPRPCPYCPPVGKICMEQYGCLPVKCEVVEHDDEAPPEEPECVEEEPCVEEPQPECCPKQETEIYIECVVEVDCPTPNDCPICPPPPIEIDPPCGKTDQGCWDMMLKERLNKDIGIDPEELMKPRPKTDVKPFASDGCTVCCKVTMDDEEVEPPAPKYPDECPPSCMPKDDDKGEPRKGCPPSC